MWEMCRGYPAMAPRQDPVEGAGVSISRDLHWHHFCHFFGALTREAALMVVSVRMSKIPDQAIKEVESSLPWKIISLES